MAHCNALACILCILSLMSVAGCAFARDLRGAKSDDTFYTCKKPIGLALCVADPCSLDLRTTAGCPFEVAPRGTTCHANYCLNAQYRGYDVGPCGLLVVDDATGEVLCGTGTRGAAESG